MVLPVRQQNNLIEEKEEENKMSDQHLELDGVVTDMCRGSFKVRVEIGGESRIVDAKLSGKMRMNKINILIEDMVRLKVSVYDTTNGFIVRRLK